MPLWVESFEIDFDSTILSEIFISVIWGVVTEREGKLWVDKTKAITLRQHEQWLEDSA